MDGDREQSLANALADALDRSTAQSAPRPPALAPELAALSEIDRVLEPPPPLPERLSGHKIIDEVGAGGMGRVLLAMDEALGRRVAIKTLAPRFALDAELRARFMDEARAMARLNHPNVARIYSLGPAEEPPHFVMEYIYGAPLTVAAARLDFREKAELLVKVALAVHFLHEQGIVHRDLKPANILVDADLEPKLLDFGLALDLSREEHRAALSQVAGHARVSFAGTGCRPRAGRSQRRFLPGRDPVRTVDRCAAISRRHGFRRAALDPRGGARAAAPPRAGRSARSAEHLPEGTRKGPCRPLRLRPRDGRRPAPLSCWRSGAGRARGLCAPDRREGWSSICATWKAGATIRSYPKPSTMGFADATSG